MRFSSFATAVIATQSNSTTFTPILTNRTSISNCTSNSTIGGSANSTVEKCLTQVTSKYNNDSNANVTRVAQGKLNCTALNLAPEMTSFNISIQGYNFTSIKTSFESFPKLNHLYSWHGALNNTRGFLHVTWDSLCRAKFFQLDITLPVVNKTQILLTTRPCVNSTIPNCLYTISLNQSQRPEEPPMKIPASRLLTDLHLDADIATAGLLHRNQMHTDEFERTGGRRLENNTLRMASGRVLDDGSTIRILYLYGNRTQARYTDATAVSLITSAFVTSNQALTGSGLSFKFELAAIAKVNYVDVTFEQTLSDLQNGLVPGVNALRDQYAADLVQMIIETTTYCGYGSLMSSPTAAFAPYAFSTVYSGCLSQYSNLHEVGHNMALQHDRANSAQQTVYYNGYGYRYCNDGVTVAPSAGYFRSIMAYSCTGSTRVPLFAGASATYSGTFTGNTLNDNVYVLQQTYMTVANFRVGTGQASGVAVVSTAAPTPRPTPSPTSQATPVPVAPAPVSRKPRGGRGNSKA